MCNVRGEDSGEIKFVAKHLESIAYLEVEGKTFMYRHIIVTVVLFFP